MVTATDAPTFTGALITETIRSLEDRGPLDDAQAIRAALSSAPNREAQVIERARVLGERLDLPARLGHARLIAPWVGLGLAGLVAMAGVGLADQIVAGGDRHINVMAALAVLLGLHALSLAAWLLALAMPGHDGAAALLGRLWLRLTARLTLGRGAEAASIGRALARLLERGRLATWSLGLASHTIWALSFVVVLAVLLFALAFRSYTLSWETTILSPEDFVSAVHWLGIVPGWLGFPAPDAAIVRAPLADAAGQRLWALWLIGCITTYGLLPRLACMAACLMVWRARRNGLAPDFALPYYRKLFARFDALTPTHVVDPDHLGASPVCATRDAAARDADAIPAQADTVLIGFELSPDLPWPPMDLAPGANANAGVDLVMRIDGSHGERERLLTTLARLRPALAVLACRAEASPDRGTARLLRDMQAACGTCRLWLIGEATPAHVARWRQWLRDAALDGIDCSTQAGLTLEGRT